MTGEGGKALIGLPPQQLHSHHATASSSRLFASAECLKSVKNSRPRNLRPRKLRPQKLRPRKLRPRKLRPQKLRHPNIFQRKAMFSSFP